MSDAKNVSCWGVHAHVLSTDDCLTQLMTTDSDSTLQLYGAMENGERDDTIVFRGSAFAGFDKGSASFQLAIEPAFENVSTDLGAVLHRQPHVYASGNGMQTRTIPVHFALGKNLVCPLGRVLELESHNGVGRPGTCKICEADTYSLDPLASPSGSGDPACFACPGAVTCKGGKDVAPKADFWMNPQGLIDFPENVSMFDAEIVLQTARRAARAVKKLSVFRCAPGACLSDWTCAEVRELFGVPTLRPCCSRWGLVTFTCVMCGRDTMDVYAEFAMPPALTGNTLQWELRAAFHARKRARPAAL